MSRRTLLFLFAAAFLAGCRHSGPPYSPKEALRTFKIAPGFRIEPFAAEPDIVSPVAMDIDENGRIYVVEDRGYPLDTEHGLGRIKLLEDTNGDGIPDRSMIFADKLVLPTGVMCWKKGILVTDAPDVWYFEDTNGDGVADVRKLVLTGFPFTNPQHTVNGPIYGLDNWIYLAHEGPAGAVVFKEKFGDRGGAVRFADRKDILLEDHGRNVRFRPDSYQIEALSGSSQFGHAFDDWGHHFTLNNSNHSRQEVIGARYLTRNPDLPVTTAMENISDHGAAAKVFPITIHPQFQLLTDIGQFTSACGLTYYHGDLFVAEPVHNIVHRDHLLPGNSAFVAKRDREGVEFLASTDGWFRPVNFYEGPDGALYVIDYYRLIIEHPEWMAREVYESRDLYKGSDRGRIYRIVPETGLPAQRKVRLGQASNRDLVRELSNPNPWWRRTAQRLLIDRGATQIVPDLIALVQGQSALGRLHALWTLDGLGALDAALVEKALHDPEAGVRENAIKLVEPRLGKNPSLAAALLEMGSDPDLKVRLQLLATLGDVSSPQSRAVRDRILTQDIEDKWVQITALSASSGEAPRLFSMAASNLTAHPSEGRGLFFRQVCSVIAARQKSAEIRSVVQSVISNPRPNATWWRAASLEGLASTRTGAALGPVADLLLKLHDSPEPPIRRASLRLLELSGLPKSVSAGFAVKRAFAIARNNAANPDERADAIRLLALSGPEQNQALFQSLVDPHQPEPVQVAAVRGLRKVKGDEIAKWVIAKWRNMTSPVRSEAADLLYTEPGRVSLLIAALKNGDIQPWTLGFRHRRQLIMHRDPAIREAARPLLEEKASDRRRVLKRYEAALDKNADPKRGEQVFKKICAKCHKLNGAGAEVGPDLATVLNRPEQSILEDILIPNKSIAQGYEAYVVETTDRGAIDGVIGPQTPITITLRHEDGKEDVIARKDIKNMYVTNLSAMPADLEKQIDVQQMADLLKFLKTAH